MKIGNYLLIHCFIEGIFFYSTQVLSGVILSLLHIMLYLFQRPKVWMYCWKSELDLWAESVYDMDTENLWQHKYNNSHKNQNAV